MEKTDHKTSRDDAWRVGLREAMTARERTVIRRAEMPMLDATYRVSCNEEVNRGLSAEQAVTEATRCLDCPDPQCVDRKSVV